MLLTIKSQALVPGSYRFALEDLSMHVFLCERWKPIRGSGPHGLDYQLAAMTRSDDLCLVLNEDQAVEIERRTPDRLCAYKADREMIYQIDPALWDYAQEAWQLDPITRDDLNRMLRESGTSPCRRCEGTGEMMGGDCPVCSW